MLERLRGVGSSYQNNSAILHRDREQVLAWAKKHRLAVSVAGAACVIVAGYLTWSLKLWNSLI